MSSSLLLVETDPRPTTGGTVPLSHIQLPKPANYVDWEVRQFVPLGHIRLPKTVNYVDWEVTT